MAMGSPCLSQTIWSFVPKPPRLRPKAWSGGSSIGPPFCAPQPPLCAPGPRCRRCRTSPSRCVLENGTGPATFPEAVSRTPSGSTLRIDRKPSSTVQIVLANPAREPRWRGSTGFRPPSTDDLSTDRHAFHYSGNAARSFATARQKVYVAAWSSPDPPSCFRTPLTWNSMHDRVRQTVPSAEPRQSPPRPAKAPLRPRTLPSAILPAFFATCLVDHP